MAKFQTEVCEVHGLHKTNPLPLSLTGSYSKIHETITSHNTIVSPGRTSTKFLLTKLNNSELRLIDDQHERKAEHYEKKDLQMSTQLSEEKNKKTIG